MAKNRVVPNGFQSYPERRSRIRTFSVSRPQSTGTEKVPGTGENSKEVTEYGTNAEVFENAKYGYGTMTEFF